MADNEPSPWRNDAAGRRVMMGRRSRSLTLVLGAILAFGTPSGIVFAASADEFYARGLKLYLAGEYNQATVELQHALEQNAQHAEAQELLHAIKEARDQQNPSGGVLSQLTEALEAQQAESRRLKGILTSAEQRLAKVTEEQVALANRLAQTQDELASAKTEAGQLRVKRNDIERLQRALTKAERDVSELTQERGRIKEEVGQQLRLREAAEEQQKMLQQQLTQVQDSMAALSRELDGLRQQSKEWKAKLELGQREQQTLQGEVAGRKKAQEAMQQELAKITQRLEQREAQMRAIYEAHGALDRQYAEVKTDHERLEAEFRTLEQQKTVLADRLTKANDELTNTKTELGQQKVKRNEVEQLQRTLSKAERDAAQSAVERSHLKEEATGLRQQLATAQQEASTLQQQLRKERDAQTKLNDDLEALRQADGELKERFAKLQREHQIARGELSGREKTGTALQEELTKVSQRLAQREEQFQKLEEVHGTLDRQYAALKAEHQKTEEQLKTAEQDRLTLSGQLSKIQDGLGTTQQQAKTTEAQLSQQLKAAQQREIKLLEKVKTLENSHQLLQEELAALADRAAGFQASLGEMGKTTTMLEQQIKDRDGKLAEAQKETQRLGQTIADRQRELGETKQFIAEGKEQQGNLQEQLKIAKETQITLNEHLKEFQAVKTQRDQLQAAAGEKEEQIKRLQDDLAGMKREFELNKHKIQLAETGTQERDEQARIERQALEWRVESLERELKEARTSEAKLEAELAGRSNNNQAEDSKFREQLANKLSERELQLKQAESVIRLLQSSMGATGGSKPGGLEENLVASIEVPEERATVVSSASQVRQQTTSGEDHPVKIYDVNNELDFVVFSVKGTDWARTGAKLLLVDDNQPIATVQLTELDSAGFAVGQIVNVADGTRQIRKGDMLMARQIISGAIGQ